ncbi:hypothetical protein [Streptomyces sp. Ac-502]|uniref:hypothetical protein n=1 Tax=Streptomyces sp. Ac-502 TaxID=3342801 RepID=UPI0038623FA0
MAVRRGLREDHGPDFRLAIGDTPVAVGTREGVDTLAAIIAGGRPCTTPAHC